MSEIRYFSFSRCDQDSHCERARYNGSEWGGTGLEPAQAGWDLVYGNLIHKYLELLAKEGKIDYVAARLECYRLATESGMATFLARDWSALAEGHLRGFVKAVWPRWMAEYEVVESEKLRSWDTVEPEIHGWGPGYPTPATTYRFRFRQDILLRSKFNGEVVYIDYKTTSDDSPKWIAHWAKSPQLHSSAYALKQLGISVDQMLVQGFNKGWKDKKTGAPGSIFVKGWVNRQFSMMPEYSYTYQRSKGWEAFSVAEEFDDLGDWVANMPSEIIIAQFPQTGPIMPRDDIAQTWFRQQLIREAEVAEAVRNLQQASSDGEVTSILDRAFRQDFNKCQPSFGYECSFKNLCWVPSVGADPLASGEYKRRLPVFEDGAENVVK